jgi:hypothetical protein
LAIDLRRRSGQEVQDKKDELTARIDERIQKVSNFRGRLEAVRVAVQQSVVGYWDVIQGKMALGAQATRTLEQLSDEQVTMVRMVAWAPAGTDGRSREETT